MVKARYPSLYQVNTRVWLTHVSRKIGRPATLDDVPDDALERLGALGFDWIWFMSVWQTGLASQQVSRTNLEWRREFEATLPDLKDDDIAGSGFAITGYCVHESLGGDAALARLRERLKKRGLKLMLDFIPNHTALDHPWITDHPDYFVAGTESDLVREPHNYTRVKRPEGDLLLAYGRDPYYPGWPDTLQLNYANLATQDAMGQELIKVAGQCDGVRCDMAMLVLPEVFERTWGRKSEPFWPMAILRVRERFPEFCFLAEVYWDLEWTLQQQGFDYTYDKRLYDRLREGQVRPVREHFFAGMDFQNKLARFLENHDELRAAVAFPNGTHQAAAVITLLSPGLRFFQQGQFEGRKIRISPHLIRAPDEPVNQSLKEFYDRLLKTLRRPAVRDGQWQLLESVRAWDGNWTNECILASIWQGVENERILVAVNYANNQSQCRVPLPFGDLAEKSWRLQDQLSSAVYDRDGNELQVPGLYLDLEPWQACIFVLKAE